MCYMLAERYGERIRCFTPALQGPVVILCQYFQGMLLSSFETVSILLQHAEIMLLYLCQYLVR
jgi:hypothetical protein